MRRFLGLLALSLASTTAGCVDTSPLVYVEPPIDAAPPPRDGDIDGAAGAACKACLTDVKGGCGAPAERCAADAKCPAVLGCLIDSQCFRFQGDHDKLACAETCFTRYDLTSATDPTIVILIDVNGCTAPNAACASACSG